MVGGQHDPPDPAAGQRWPLHARWYAAGAAILLAGLIAAAVIYFVAGPDGATDRGFDAADQRIDDYNIERIGGKAAVYVSQFNRWLGGLWHGRPLAFTVAALTIVASLVCFWVADLAAVPLTDEPDEERQG